MTFEWKAMGRKSARSSGGIPCSMPIIQIDEKNALYYRILFTSHKFKVIA